MNAKSVIDVLTDQGVIDKGQADEALQEISTSGKDVITTLVDFGLVTEENFYQYIAESLGTEVVDLTGYELPPETARLIQAGLARLHGAVPLGIDRAGTLRSVPETSTSSHKSNPFQRSFERPRHRRPEHLNA